MSTTQSKTKYGYVYKHIDTKDGIVKYVGLVNPGNSLTQRVLQHKNDDWYRSDFEVYYIKVQSKTDAEFLESAFINHYKSYKYYNRAKDNWGTSSLIDLNNFDWEDYKVFKDDRKHIPKVRKKQKLNRNDIEIHMGESLEEVNEKRFYTLCHNCSEESMRLLKMFHRKFKKGKYEQCEDCKRIEINIPTHIFKNIYHISTYEDVKQKIEAFSEEMRFDYLSLKNGVMQTTYTSLMAGALLNPKKERTSISMRIPNIIDKCFLNLFK